MSTSERPDSAAMKRRLKKKRRKSLAEDVDKELLSLSSDMAKLYIGILKYKYKVECKKSLLSPGHYVIKLHQYWVPFEQKKVKITRHTIVLRPVGEKNARF